MLKAGLLLALVFCGIAAGDEWKYRGPGELDVLSIVPDRSNPHIVFVIIKNDPHNWRGALYRSLDHGAHWQPTVLKHGVTQILIHPKSAAVLALLADENFANVRFWISTDHGKTFEQSGKIQGSDRIIWHPIRGRTLYRTNPFYQVQPQRSDDLGSTWQTLAKFPNRAGGCSVSYWESIDLLPFQGNLYGVAEASRPRCRSGTLTPFLLQSKDRGSGWKIISRLPETPEQRNEYDYYRFHWDPAFPGRVLLHGFSGIVALQLPEVNAISNFNAYQLVSVPGHPTKLYAVSTESGELFSNGIAWESNDAGVTWKQLDDSRHNSITVLQAVGRGATREKLLAGTFLLGIYSRSDGPDWRSANRGLIKAHSRKIDSITKSGSRLYAVIFDRFLFRRNSLDSGWQNLSFQYRLAATERIISVRVNPGNKDHVLLLTNEYPKYSLLVSKDGGINWRRSAIEDPYSLEFSYSLQFVFDPGNSNILYLFNARSLLKSTDGGLTAERLPLNFGIDFLVVSPFDSRTLYFLSQTILYRSNDGGQSAQRVGNRSFYIVAFTTQPNVLLAAESLGEVYRSIDGGEHWRKIGRANVDPDETCEHPAWCAPIALYTTDASHYFLLSLSQLFFESNDAGKTWIPVNRPVYDVTDPSDPPLFIATSKGVYQKNKK